MDTLMWKILLAILLFADGNIAYFEIRRLILLVRNHQLDKGTKPSDDCGSTGPRLEIKT